MDFSDRMVDLAARLLTRFGANGTLIAAGEAYDPATDTVVADRAEPRQVRMVVGPMETLDENGVEVFRTVARLRTQPFRNDTIVFAGTTYTVGNVITRYAADKAVIYFAEVR